MSVCSREVAGNRLSTTTTTAVRESLGSGFHPQAAHHFRSTPARPPNKTCPRRAGAVDGMPPGSQHARSSVVAGIRSITMVDRSRSMRKWDGSIRLMTQRSTRPIRDTRMPARRVCHWARSSRPALNMIIVSEPSAEATQAVRTARYTPAHHRSSAAHNDTPRHADVRPISVRRRARPP